MKINAHVPTQQYGFIELTDLPDDPAEVERIYNRYAEQPISLKNKGKLIDCFVGGQIEYDDLNHIYTWKGEKYLSGSEYAKRFAEPFDSRAVAKKMADKASVDVESILKMWSMAGDISTGLGSAIHAGLELRGKYSHLADVFTKDYTLHANPAIKAPVEAFFKDRANEKAEYEAVVVDHTHKFAGCIDRIVLEGEKKAWVEDFKTGKEITPKKMEEYWHQLSLYAHILIANGYHVLGLRIHYWDGLKWMTSESRVKDLVGIT